ncbi:MAG: hypothetical protein C0176_05255 [Mesoaciditoga sp.]|uniref:hypothetical protein n=1 Tax=Athalassotoga sp. TaxID=2022597 RepID=UPI000CB6250B|nr:MAG: hypothetical protein C0176_05255 [Mesoaciditoga sp.]HEU24981.1 hypothetical protein [Mesoaciditoga lauensis]
MLRPIDLQVVIVKSVDNAQNTNYAQQSIIVSQQVISMENEIKNDRNSKRVISRERYGNDPSKSATDVEQNAEESESKKDKIGEKISDPYRGKVIDIRL